MAIAERLKAYLREHDAEYELISHIHTGSSLETAEAARVPGDCLAKGIVLKDGKGYVLVVVPADYHVDLDVLNRQFQREMQFASEEELGGLFPDCELGAVPPIGAAYGVETHWDVSLGGEREVYFEAGDHQSLVRVSGEQFHQLMATAERGRFSHHI
jgi:Ala-tRNA(Pro) deacylase